jgi:hypothetical protein
MSKLLPCFSIRGFCNLVSAESWRTAGRAWTTRTEPAHGVVSACYRISLRLQPLVYSDGQTSRC